MDENKHISVLHDESIQHLDLSKNDIVIDGTLGGAGHSLSICKELGSKGKLIAFDLDQSAIDKAREKLADCKCSVDLVHDNFRNIKQYLQKNGLKANKILLDLGFSSNQLEYGGRGISFQKEEPLLMTLKDNPDFNDLKAYDILNTWEEEDIANIIFQYGEERFSRRIAASIIEERKKEPITTTTKLVDIVKWAIPKRFHHRRINPATKTFQALRIAVNDELGVVESVISDIPEILAPGGIIAIISFHSLEDRIVKHGFRGLEDNGFGKRITKKPIIPSEEELEKNRRARSSKLRVFQLNEESEEEL